MRIPDAVHRHGVGYNRHIERVLDLVRPGWEPYPRAPLDPDVWNDLVEPVTPLRLTTDKVRCDGAWALRIMIYNRGPAAIDAGGLTVDLAITPAPDVQLLEWQANDHRFRQDRSVGTDSDVTTDTLRTTHKLDAKHKLRDELAVIFNSRITNAPPEVKVSAQAPVKWKVRAHRPARTIARAVERRVNTVGMVIVKAVSRLGLLPMPVSRGTERRR